MSLKWVCITVGLLALFALGVLAGFFVLHFPFIEFNNEIGIFDALHFLLALGLGIWVPFVIKKAIEDKRDIKAYIVEGIKDFIDDLEEVKEIIATSYETGSFSSTERDKIICAFHFLELHVASIEAQVKISFPRQTDGLSNELKKALFEYENYLTDGELMHSSFTTIDYRFFTEHGTEYSKLETSVKRLIHKVYRF